MYVPDDRPAIGNLMTMFDFFAPHFGTVRLSAHPESASGVTPDFVARLP